VPDERTLLFYRDFRAYSGGHQKVFDYYQHTLASGLFTSRIAFSPDTLWDESNPWKGLQNDKRLSWEPERYTALFIGGLDWEQVPADYGGPVINLVQHLRHADPADPRYRFLERRAIRICVSAEVAAAITASGKARGPVLTIPNGLAIPMTPGERTVDVFVLGSKNPQLCATLAASLSARGCSVRAQSARAPRHEVLQSMAASRVAVLLPNPAEGFYLPALEAMALADVTVVPDCIGNRSFCHHQRNCLMPGYAPEALLGATQEALRLSRDGGARLEALRTEARRTVEAHSLERERAAFIAILARLDELWAGNGEISIESARFTS
jgi:hypothetical protein